jgi:predicted unusual protein kinase regulating ubiquinone biosynthesis (AarF/ABC1/UbiB family)
MQTSVRRLAKWSLAATSIALIVQLLRRSLFSKPQRQLSSMSATRTSRSAAVAKTTTKIGARVAVSRARKVFATAEQRQQIDVDLQLQSASDVAETLGNLKGAMMKIGQMASYLDDGMPAPMREALASLQQDSPPMSGALAAEVITQELGGAPSEIFAEWDPTPIASASIGQVHRALTHDGQAVAVKVQYPGIAEAISSDLANADLIARLMSMVYPGLDPKPFTAELSARINEELDYTIEATNQQLFADFYRDHPFIVVPDVVTQLSTSRVLTSALSPGYRFSVAETWDQQQRNDTAELLFRFAFRSLYRLHAFNGDPHPGNYLVEHVDDPALAKSSSVRVTFLDFGLVRRFTNSDVTIFEDLLKSMVTTPDPEMFRRVLEDAQLLRTDAPFTTSQVNSWFANFYEYLLAEQPVTMTPEYAARMVRQTFNFGENDILRHTNVPPNFVLLQRITVGLNGVVAKLRPTLNFRGIAEELWPWTDAAPCTPIGRCERELWPYSVPPAT